MLRFFIIFILYVFCYLSLQVLPKEPLFLISTKALPSISQKASELSLKVQESNLLLNFVGNIRELSSSEKRLFTNSGLMHLLAISGAQIVPIAYVLSYVFCKLFVILLCKFRLNPSKIMTKMQSVRAFIAFIVAFFMTYILGFTGALIRSSFVSYAGQLPYLQKIFLPFYLRFPLALPRTYFNIFSLFLISHIFGNILFNFSFLLSTLGCLCLEISSNILKIALKNKKHGSSKLLQFLKKSSFKNALLIILTSLLMSICLSPFSNFNPLKTCASNLIAGPWVGLIVTPLSLLVLFLPKTCIFFPYILQIFDKSLSVFKQIGVLFSSTNVSVFALFNDYARHDLILLVFTLFIINDFFARYSVFFKHNNKV